MPSKDVYAGMAPATYTRQLGAGRRSTMVPRNKRRKKIRKVSFVRTQKINEAFEYLESKYDPELAEVWDIYRSSIKDQGAGRGYEAKWKKGPPSSVYPGLERVPGEQNWVDQVQGLPSLVERVAKHLHYEKGYTISRAIATAVNWNKKMCSTGTAFGGKVKVGARAKAAACRAVAQWERKKGQARATPNKKSLPEPEWVLESHPLVKMAMEAPVYDPMGSARERLRAL
jgi:hypothetical protein